MSDAKKTPPSKPEIEKIAARLSAACYEYMSANIRVQLQPDDASVLGFAHASRELAEAAVAQADAIEAVLSEELGICFDGSCSKCGTGEPCH